MTTEKSAESLEKKPNNNENLELTLVRDILLRQDREDIADIKDIFEDNEKLADRVNPIIEVHLESLKRRFPKEYKRQVEMIVERKLRSSQDELLNVIYPVMGKMIMKYINQQIQGIKDSVDESRRSVFSLEAWKRRIRSVVTGASEHELHISDLNQMSIEQIFVIERNSGILMGEASTESETIDSDLIAGMLTAIKSFVEDAFNKEKQELELIDYGLYKIFVQSFHLYYVAVIIDGPVSRSEKEELSSQLFDFAEEEISELTPGKLKEGDVEMLSSKLAEHFFNLDTK